MRVSEPMDYEIVEIDRRQAVPSVKSGTDNISLTEALGCSEMRARVWYLSPGDAMSYHRQAEQEELYLNLDGPGRMHVGDETLTVNERTALRVAPPTPRQLFNDTDEDHTWLVVGAPPVDNDGQALER